MRKFISLFVVLGIIFLIFSSTWFEESNLNPLDYARITEVDYRAVVVDEPGSDGKVIVTERLTFEIHAASRGNLFWELWRDLSEEYIDGVKVDYNVISVKQILEDKPDVIYEQSPRLYWEDDDYINTARGLGPGKWYHSEGPYNENRRQYECVLFYVDGLYRETVVFEIEYEMYNAALRYNDCSELYITPYSESTINFLKSFKGQILIPNEMMPMPGNYDAYTYGTNFHDFPFTESGSVNPGYHTFSFELNESQLKFKPYNQYIEFSLISHGEDKHIFTQYASVNDYYYDDVLWELNEEQAKYEALPETFRRAKVIVCILLSIAALMVLVYAFGFHKKMKKKYHFYEPTMHLEYFRDIPSELDPNFAASLVFCKHKPPKDTQYGYAAIMLNLVRKGYIELEKIRNELDWNTNNVKIVVKYRPAQPQPVQAPQDKMRCPQCGNSNRPQMNYCIYCGAPLPQQQEAPQPIQQPVTANIQPLSPTEEQYFNLILRHSNGFDMSLSTFQQRVSGDYENTNFFVKNIKNAIVIIGATQGYFQKAEFKKPAQHTKQCSLALGIIGVLFLIAGNIASYQTRLDLAFGAFFILGIGFMLGAVHLYKLSHKYVLLTQFGEDEYAKWRGLYRFLDSSTLMSERTIIELSVWERYLVYATAFGISEKVIKAINVRCPNADTSPILRNPYYRSVHFRSSGRSFRTATRSASFSSMSAGYGGHGGYGGGGRGGGGGGGGH